MLSFTPNKIPRTQRLEQSITPVASRATSLPSAAAVDDVADQMPAANHTRQPEPTPPVAVGMCPSQDWFFRAKVAHGGDDWQPETLSSLELSITLTSRPGVAAAGVHPTFAATIPVATGCTGASVTQLIMIDPHVVTATTTTVGHKDYDHTAELRRSSISFSFVALITSFRGSSTNICSQELFVVGFQLSDRADPIHAEVARVNLVELLRHCGLALAAIGSDERSFVVPHCVTTAASLGFTVLIEQQQGAGQQAWSEPGRSLSLITLQRAASAVVVAGYTSLSVDWCGSKWAAAARDVTRWLDVGEADSNDVSGLSPAPVNRGQSEARTPPPSQKKSGLRGWVDWARGVTTPEAAPSGTPSRHASRPSSSAVTPSFSLFDASTNVRDAGGAVDSIACLAQATVLSSSARPRATAVVDVAFPSWLPAAAADAIPSAPSPLTALPMSEMARSVGTDSFVISGTTRDVVRGGRLLVLTIEGGKFVLAYQMGGGGGGGGGGADAVASRPPSFGFIVDVKRPIADFVAHLSGLQFTDVWRSLARPHVVLLADRSDSAGLHNESNGFRVALTYGGATLVTGMLLIFSAVTSRLVVASSIWIICRSRVTIIGCNSIRLGSSSIFRVVVWSGLTRTSCVMTPV